MNEKKELLELLETYIVHVRRSYEKKYPLTLNEELCLFLKEKIDKLNNDYREIVSLELSKILELLPTYSENNMYILGYYSFVLTNTKFELPAEDVEVLQTVCKDLSENLDSYMNNINEFKKKKEEEILKIVGPYKIIVDKLKGNMKLNSDDIQHIYNMIKISNNNINESIKMMRYLFNENLKQDVVLDVNDEVEESEEEVVMVDTTNLTYDELFNLFSKYKIDFGKFAKEEQEELLKYGNINNIEEILKKLLEYGVDISDYLGTRNQAIKSIFLYSNSIIVGDLIDNFIKYGILNKENGKLDISVLLERPSRFLNRKKKWARRSSDVKHVYSIEGVAGCFEDVIKNLEYFAQEGLDVAKSYGKSECYFDLPHEKILEVVRTFQLYNIDKKDYLRTLSCFSSKHQADVIDLFIELGYLDYLKNNMSRILRLPESPMFYKLARGNQLGKKPKMYGKTMDGNITNDSRVYLDVDSINGKELTRQYVYEFDNKQYYDDIISSKESNSISVILVAQKDLIITMDKKFIVIENDGYPDYRLYNIGGVLISRIKFLRILNTLLTSGVEVNLESIMYALTRNSIITKEQFDVVYSNISELYEKVPTKKGGRR